MTKKLLLLILLCWFILCHPLVSAETKKPEQDQNQEPSPAPEPSGSKTESDKQPEKDKQPGKDKQPEDDFTRFIPTEDISADNAVAFPVDI